VSWDILKKGILFQHSNISFSSLASTKPQKLKPNNMKNKFLSACLVTSLLLLTFVTSKAQDWLEVHNAKGDLVASISAHPDNGWIYINNADAKMIGAISAQPDNGWIYVNNADAKMVGAIEAQADNGWIYINNSDAKMIGALAAEPNNGWYDINNSSGNLIAQISAEPINDWIEVHNSANGNLFLSVSKGTRTKYITAFCFFFASKL
jgi:hypothetical protein